MSNKIAFQSQSSTWIKKIKPINDQHQNDKKNYRILCILSQNNLYNFIKQHKSCLGDAETPIKITMVQQDINSSKSSLQHFQKYEDKLIKSMVLRNNIAFKQQNIYMDAYHKNYHKDPLFQGNCPQSEIQSKNSYFSPEKIKDKQKSRPMSAIVQIQKNTSISFNRNLTKRKLFANNHGNNNFQKEKRKCSIAVNSFHYIDKKCVIQTLKDSECYQRQCSDSLNAQQAWNQMRQDGQVFIRKKIMDSTHRQTVSIKKMRPVSNSCYSTGMKNPYKNSFNREKQRMLMQFSEKQKIQKKILMINSVLAYNLTQSQGYQPKSKLKNGPLF